MPRIGNPARRRKALLPELARTFAEFGYRRTTTAELARRCGVQETILYRLWPSKKHMFQAAIGYVYDLSLEVWNDRMSRKSKSATAAKRLLAYEASHHGEFGLYRIVFAGLSDTDDPEIRQALKTMYARFHQFIRSRIEEHFASEGAGKKDAGERAELAAWAFVGLGTMADIGRELGLFSDRRRSRLIRTIGGRLLQGEAP